MPQPEMKNLLKLEMRSRWKKSNLHSMMKRTTSKMDQLMMEVTLLQLDKSDDQISTIFNNI